MANQNLKVVSDNPRHEIIRKDTHPISYGNNRQVAQEQWEQIAHNLPVGESVSFTETTTRTQTFSHSSSASHHQHREPHTAGDWLTVLVIIAVFVGVVVGVLVALLEGL